MGRKGRVRFRSRDGESGQRGTEGGGGRKERGRREEEGRKKGGARIMEEARSIANHSL